VDRPAGAPVAGVVLVGVIRGRLGTFKTARTCVALSASCPRAVSSTTTFIAAKRAIGAIQRHENTRANPGATRPGEHVGGKLYAGRRISGNLRPRPKCASCSTAWSCPSAD
jgi:hypothetical protein